MGVMRSGFWMHYLSQLILGTLIQKLLPDAAPICPIEGLQTEK